MKVILRQEVKKLGQKGDVVNVSDGYARNFLFPQKLAEPFTEGGQKLLETEHKTQEAKAARLLKQAQDEAQALSGKTFTIKAKAGEKGRLFGSITNQDVASAIKSQSQMDIPKRDITLEETIKQLGTYTVKAKLHPRVIANVKIEVIEE